MDWDQACEDYQRIEQAIRYIEQNKHLQPTLSEVAGSIGLSEYHFQRLFKRWAGISPKRFLQFLTKEEAKKMLEQSLSVEDTAYSTGLSSLGRLHDLFVTYEAVTPGEFKRYGQGILIRYGIHPSPFGMCLIASTERGICNLSFLPENTQDEYITRFFERWKLAEIKHDQAGTTSTRDQVFQFVTNGFSGKLDLHLMGTNYQLKVWEALMSIPSGSLISYGRLADRMGQVNSSRSIGGAVSKNPISLIIPCHRVIYQVGDFGHYQGGDTRKKAILGWEMSRYTS